MSSGRLLQATGPATQNSQLIYDLWQESVLSYYYF